MDKPAEKLAARILERLTKEQLLSEPQAKKLLPKLSDGRVRPEDWRMAIDISTAKEDGQ